MSPGVLVGIAVLTLAGTLLLSIAIWPAFVLAGAPLRDLHKILISGLCMTVSWITIAFAWNFSVNAVFPSTHFTSIYDYIIVIAPGLLFPLAGHLNGKIMRWAAPLPGVTLLLTLAGLVVGIIVALGSALRIDLSNAGFVLPFAVHTAVWLGPPIAAVYISAILQYRTLNRYTACRCTTCGYQLAPDASRCPECGVRPRRLCHHCNNIVDAQQGHPCPRCKTLIAARCWNCGYDCAGIPASTNCPECGAWKPVTPDPEVSPA